MTVLLQDLEIAWRQLWRRPGFTLSAVLTLAIGMSVNAVAFTVVNGLLFKGAEMRHSPDLGRILTTPGGDESGNVSLPEYERFAEATRGALTVAVEGRSAVAWRHAGTTQTAWVLFVSSNYFSQVEARPLAGRVDVARAADGRPSVVIGERFWRTKLDAASIAGLTLRFNNVDVNVTGVLPESFQGPAGLYSPDAWLPLDALTLFNTAPALQTRDQRWLFVIGRVTPGITLPEVQGRIDAAVLGMAHDWPETHRQRGARFRLFREGNSELRSLSIAATGAMGTIGLVLLLACFNVANLLLARAVERERDMGIRAAIGAGTMRLIRLVVTEGFVLALLAGSAALVVAWWTQVLVGSFAIPIEQPQYIDLAPDGRVVAFIAGLIVIAGVLPGLWPAIRAARVDIVRVLGSQGANAAGGRPNPMRRWLVAAQVAGSTAFLALAALLAQTYANVSLTDVGFDRERLVLAEFEPAAHGYDTEQSQRYVDALRERIDGLPAVSSVAVADRAPFFIGFDRLTPVSIVDSTCKRDDCLKVETLIVGAGYFKTMGIQLIAGREFESGNPAREAIINQPLARLLWPDPSTSPEAPTRGLGEKIRIGESGEIVTVVAITSKTHTRSLNRERPALYLPFAGDAFDGHITLVAHTSVPPTTVMRSISEAAQDVDQNVALSAVKTMEQRMAVQLWPFRTVSWLFSICGMLALVFASVGLAGVVIHAVNRRMREFGVRVSVGATPRDLVLDVLGGGARLLFPGLLAGIVIAALTARALQGVFYGVNVLNPLSYVAIALLESAIVLIACASPALRASHLDPLIALRSE
jgi:predicted permease